MKLYTKTGDGGETSLFDGSRVSKADDRVQAYGDVDELNAWLGLARSAGPDPDVDALLMDIQRQLFAPAQPRRRLDGPPPSGRRWPRHVAPPHWPSAGRR